MQLSLKIIFATVLIFLICFSFKRYSYFSLDGDLPAIVLPVKSYMPVMKDPFGLNVLFHDSVYAATNRFFVHFFLTVYFKNVPLWLQHFFKPIDSIYIACALAKTAIHFFLIYLIALYVTNKKQIWNFDFLLVALLITPLFQTYGYYIWMAIIDNSVTYTFFYALSLSLVLLFFLPFLNSVLGRSSFNFSWLKIVALVILVIIISFSGPLNSPVILLVCSTALLYYFVGNYLQQKTVPFIQRLYSSFKSIPLSLLSLFTIAIITGLYSYYIGRNNSENLWQVIPLSERYSRLITGFWYQYTNKLGQPLLIAAVIVNAFLIYRLKPNDEALKVLKLLRWFAILSIIYILLLPLGGYRSYRENIIRFDTILPITIGLILFYGYTTLYILKNLHEKYKLTIYIIIILAISAVYINADLGIRKYNLCERYSISKIAKSNERVVFIDNDCWIMNWGKTMNPKESRNKTDLLLYWNVLKEQKLYYQK